MPERRSVFLHEISIVDVQLGLKQTNVQDKISFNQKVNISDI